MALAGLRILVVEDEPAIADTLLYALRTEGFASQWCATGEAALAALAAQAYALLILDIGLPDGDGFDLCRRVRLRTSLPIIFLTARGGEIDRVVGLELGADDYVAKPFSPREVAARVKAVLRRTRPPSDAVIGAREIGAFRLEEEFGRIVFQGVTLELTRYEYRLLKTLLGRPGRIFSRDELMTQAWEDPGSSLDRTIDAHIKTLRAKLRAVAPEAGPIQTHRGMGYSVQPLP